MYILYIYYEILGIYPVFSNTASANCKYIYYIANIRSYFTINIILVPTYREFRIVRSLKLNDNFKVSTEY